jgi:hypothetical protein
MQETLANSGTITLSLQAKDFDTADRDLRSYVERSERLENLIVQLNLSDTDVELFFQHNEQNLADLEELRNLTERFSHLEKLEVTYRTEERPDLLYSISYEGEALRNKVGALAQEYTSRKDSVLEVSQSFEINTSGYETSVSAVAEIASEVVARQTERAIQLEEIPDTPYRLTLQLNPISAGYGEEIAFSGAFVAAPFRSPAVSLYVDSALWRDKEVDTMGSFQVSFPVQRIRAGTHLAYAMFSHTYSEMHTFTIFSRPTKLTLFSSITDDHRIHLSGTLFAGTIPVSSAPVELYCDGRVLRTVHTDGEGSFATLLDLSPEEHQIRARFASREFPLEPSETEVTVSAPPDMLPAPFPGTLALAVVATSVGGAIWLLPRKKGEKVVEAVSLQQVAPADPLLDLPRNDADQTLSTYWNLLERDEVQGAVHLLYRSLVECIAQSRDLPHAHALTPRELIPYLPDFLPSSRWFMDFYEQVRYGGHIPDKAACGELADHFRSLMMSLGGDSC